MPFGFSIHDMATIKVREREKQRQIRMSCDTAKSSAFLDLELKNCFCNNANQIGIMAHFETTFKN